MDVDATLAEIRELTNREVKERLTEVETQRLRELFDYLDTWLSAGGYFPAAWRPF